MHDESGATTSPLNGGLVACDEFMNCIAVIGFGIALS